MAELIVGLYLLFVGLLDEIRDTLRDLMGPPIEKLAVEEDLDDHPS